MKPGIWLLASLNSHGTTKGMRLKFQDVECYRDYQYEYSEYDNLPNKEFNVWNPLSLETIKQNEKKPVLVEKTNGEIDAYTELFANELGLRSLKQQSNSSDVDLLDLSFLDYEVVDVLNDTQPYFTKPKNKTLTAEINGLTDNSVSKRMDGQNLTAADFLNQLNSTNTTATQNSSSSAFLNHSANEKQKTNILPTAEQPLNGSTAPNSSSSDLEVRSNLTGTIHGSNLTALDSNVTSFSPVNRPADGIKTSLSAPKANGGNNGSIEGYDSSSQKARGPHLSSAEKVNPFISRSENDTSVFKNSSATANLSASNTVNNESDGISPLNQPSNETVGSSVPSLSNNEIASSPEEFSNFESSEEVFIFVKDKNAGAIKTTSVKTSGQNWTYDGTHQIVPMEIPNDVKKYFENSPQPKKKKTRKVTLPHRPQKGQGLKTKRRKEYKPQPRSGLPISPFSPRGLNPIMSPRGARPQGLQPVNDEENLINVPVVIGVPRPDFSDYELYLPGDEPDHLGLDEKSVKANEYEYVSYKDPYSSDEDAKNFHLDQANKYLKNTDKDVQTYFIAAEEVQWDYAGYGQR